MTITSGGAVCRYCWRRVESHQDACPIKIGTKVAMAAWDYGHGECALGRSYEDWEMKNFHPSRRLGATIGMIEWDRAEQEADRIRDGWEFDSGVSEE